MFKKSLIPDGRFAIAFSGGGDSTALVHMLRGYNPLVLIVDHALRDGSAAEAMSAGSFAQALGLETRILTWEHDNPKTGLQEKARKARYGLMGQVCRELGISYLLTGHTEDDQAETLLMRQDRGTDWRGAAGISEKIYAPVWPQLAGITILRPLLNMSRDTLRTYNQTHGLKWAEDPSNQNRNFTRIRARDNLIENNTERQELLDGAQTRQQELETERQTLRAFVTRHVSVDKYGIVKCALTPPDYLMGILLRVASGTGNVVGKQSLADLSDNMKGEGFSGATLGGAMVIPTKTGFAIGRDPMAAKGRAGQAPLPMMPLVQNVPLIWDGRFEIISRCSGTRVQVYGRAGVKRETQDRYYEVVAHRLRQSLPLILHENEDQDTIESVSQTGQTIAQASPVSIRSLVASRLHGTLGIAAD